MTAAKRSRLSPEARRAQLLELGVQMLSTRTLDELSIEALSEEAGISRGLLFHYFKNKQDYHRAVVQLAADDLIATTAPDLALEPIPRLRQSLEQYVHYVRSNYRGYICLVRGAASGDAALRDIFDRTRAILTARITEHLAAFGLPDTPAVRLLAGGWSAMVEETVLAWVPDPQIPEAELLHVLTAALPALLGVGGRPALTRPAPDR